MGRTAVRRWSRKTGALLVGVVTPVAGGSLGAAGAAGPTSPPTPPVPPVTPSTLPAVRIPTSASGCTGYYGGNTFEPPQCIYVNGTSNWVNDVDTYIPPVCYPCGYNGSGYWSSFNTSGEIYGYWQEVMSVQRPGQSKVDYNYGPVTGKSWAGQPPGQDYDFVLNQAYADGTQICGMSRYSADDPYMINYSVTNSACEDIIYTGSAK